MTELIDRPAEPGSGARYELVDCDAHPIMKGGLGDLRPFLSRTDQRRLGLDERRGLTTVGHREAVSIPRNTLFVNQAGVLRDDVHPDDLTFVFEQVASLHGPTPERTAELRARYLTLQLDGLCAPARTPLPGPPPTTEEQHARWR